MKKSSKSRRKFLTGMGAAAAVTMLGVAGAARFGRQALAGGRQPKITISQKQFCAGRLASAPRASKV